VLGKERVFSLRLMLEPDTIYLLGDDHQHETFMPDLKSEAELERVQIEA